MTDKKYVTERDKLIPFAERYTNELHGVTPTGDRDKWTNNWNATFHRKMNALAKEQGLTRGQITDKPFNQQHSMNPNNR